MKKKNSKKSKPKDRMILKDVNKKINREAAERHKKMPTAFGIGVG